MGRARPGATVRGPYKAVNRRLTELVASGSALLSVEDVPVGDSGVELGLHREASVSPPPAGLLPVRDEAAKYADLRRARSGPLVTSYTRLKGANTPSPAAPERGGKPEATAGGTGLTPLRSARASGVFLHELLERVPMHSFAGQSEPAAWRARPEISALFDEAVVVHGIDNAQREHAERIVWGAYTTSLDLGAGHRIDRLADASRVVREMTFVYPVLSGTGPIAFVRGSIDLAFEHEGLIYFVDWKSDSLAAYSPAALERHVHAYYEAQTRLYAIAIAKLVGSKTSEELGARFGGMLYCFLRGLDARGAGVWFARPSWEELRAWEVALAHLGGVHSPAAARAHLEGGLS